MAVPFNMPEDHNEVDVYINQLQSLLTQLQIAVRQSRGIIPPTNIFSSAITRVRNVNANRRTVEETDGRETAITPDEASNNLDWLSSMIQENIQESSSRSPGRYCRDREETKIITTIVNTSSVQDWAQIGNVLRKIADDLTPVTREDFLSPSRSKESLLSKLPDTLTCSIWTAMLGCVGWHIFRAR